MIAPNKIESEKTPAENEGSAPCGDHDTKTDDAERRNGESDGARNHTEHQTPSHKANRVLMYAAVASALGAVAGAAFAGWSNHITQQSVDDARYHARTELRPYISVTGRITNINRGGTMTVRLVITNTGRTPANGLKVNYEATGGRSQSSRKGAHPMPCPCCDPSNTRFTRANVPTTLPPGGEAVIDHTFPQSVRMDLLRHNHPIRAFGCISFESVFGEPLAVRAASV